MHRSSRIGMHTLGSLLQLLILLLEAVEPPDLGEGRLQRVGLFVLVLHQFLNQRKTKLQQDIGLRINTHRKTGTYQHKPVGLMGGLQERGDVVLLLLVTDHPPAAFIILAGLDTLPRASNSGRLQPGDGLPTALRHDDKVAATRPRGSRLATRRDDHLDAAK